MPAKTDKEIIQDLEYRIIELEGHVAYWEKEALFTNHEGYVPKIVRDLRDKIKELEEIVLQEESIGDYFRDQYEQEVKKVEYVLETEGLPKDYFKDF